MNKRELHAAAVKHNGVIYTGKRHADILRHMHETGVEGRPTLHDQGFVDGEGSFLNRETAKLIAIQYGQIPETFEGTLHSEDLW